MVVGRCGEHWLTRIVVKLLDCLTAGRDDSLTTKAQHNSQARRDHSTAQMTGDEVETRVYTYLTHLVPEAVESSSLSLPSHRNQPHARTETVNTSFSHFQPEHDPNILYLV